MSDPQGNTRPRVTFPLLRRMKAEQRKIVSVTAYDYTFSRLLDEAGVDILLVGDSLSMVVQGHDTTLPVTLEEMIYHTKAVVRGSQRALVICDMPFGSFQQGVEHTLANAIRVMKESGAHGIKLEWCIHAPQVVKTLSEHGIPVVGHVGLTPQSVHRFGGYRVQGRGEDAASRILHQSQELSDAGADLIILEGIPAPLAHRITSTIATPTVGIGAGAGCDGQVLVLYDLLGLYSDFQPRFVKRYLEGASLVKDAVGNFIREVQSGDFPAAQHTFAE
ncbi:MAG: 3-methyl-2-oxobutanoate hydroxymethyltransferase [Magnetococcales bacterium]|nr:3-methyl-2-oxobutanoate hydroxymethyltransferase [Magnetococcales bacterium]NGZ25697.1 3-methyl-2-oxobutanoate hydroxymethyltransferase [Magnetococcales bacterium]